VTSNNPNEVPPHPFLTARSHLWIVPHLAICKEYRFAQEKCFRTPPPYSLQQHMHSAHARLIQKATPNRHSKAPSRYKSTPTNTSQLWSLEAFVFVPNVILRKAMFHFHYINIFPFSVQHTGIPVRQFFMFCCPTCSHICSSSKKQPCKTSSSVYV
jgi:hypothetical protein